MLFFSSLIFALDEEKIAKSLDLDPVLEAHPYNFFGVSSMYANDPLTRQMLVIQNVDAALKEMRIIEGKGFFVVEFPKNEKSYSSFAFVGIKQEEVKPLLNSSLSVTSFLEQVFFLLPESRANQTCDVKAPSSFSSIEVLHKYYEIAYVKDTLKCLNHKLPPFKENLELLTKDPELFWVKKIREHRNLLAFISSAKKSDKLCAFLTTLKRSELETIFSNEEHFKVLHKKFEVYLDMN